MVVVVVVVGGADVVADEFFLGAEEVFIGGEIRMSQRLFGRWTLLRTEADQFLQGKGEGKGTA